jgi:hypothetical protein
MLSASFSHKRRPEWGVGRFQGTPVSGCRNGLAEHKFLSALPRPSAGPHAVEKLLLPKFAKINASGCALNDLLGPDRHFLSPNFSLFLKKTTFSLFQQPCLISSTALTVKVNGILHSNLGSNLTALLGF